MHRRHRDSSSGCLHGWSGMIDCHRLVQFPRWWNDSRALLLIWGVILSHFTRFKMTHLYSFIIEHNLLITIAEAKVSFVIVKKVQSEMMLIWTTAGQMPPVFAWLLNVHVFVSCRTIFFEPAMTNYMLNPALNKQCLSLQRYVEMRHFSKAQNSMNDALFPQFILLGFLQCALSIYI